MIENLKIRILGQKNQNPDKSIVATNLKILHSLHDSILRVLRLFRNRLDKISIVLKLQISPHTCNLK